MKNNYKNLIFSLLLPFLAGAIGNYFTAPAIDTWYQSLEKPFFNPPNWVFGPVWTILYIFIGISLYFVIATKRKNKIGAFTLFGIQLTLNSIWSIFFFGIKNIGAAFGIIIALWMFIAATIYHFYFINKKSAYLLIPYLLWVSFAGVLNYFILILN